MTDAILSWPREADEARNWAGANTLFPVTAETMRTWHAEPSIQPFVATERGHPIAYGELWADETEHEIELARIIVRPHNRNTGIGRAFVGLLVEQAGKFGFDNLFLRVLPANRFAIRCYESCGFVPVPDQQQAVYNRNQPAHYIWMEHLG